MEPLPSEHQLDVPRFEQPDDVTCGPACLLQVLRFYQDPVTFEQVLARTPRNPDGGTLAVYLGLAGLRMGYQAAIYPYNLRIFDPTWYRVPREDLAAKLRGRSEAVAGQNPKLRASIDAHGEFLTEGGQHAFAELTPRLIMRILTRGHPVLCGLSSTYLYRQMRERPLDNEEDDVAGEPTGHFVTICGYADGGKHFMVRDPASHVPFSQDGRYVVPAHRLINSILLGIVTYDAVLLELWPEDRRV